MNVKIYKKDFNKTLIKRFVSTYEFCNRDINRFAKKGVNPDGYVDSWEMFYEDSLPNTAKYGN